MRWLIAIALFIVTPAFAAESPPPVAMTRADAMAVFNTLVAIGQPYKGTTPQGGQNVPIDKFLDVSAPMRSTLVHDMTIFKTIAIETAKLQDDAKQRLGSDAAALAKENETIAQEKVNVEGLTLFTESDLQLDKNPQITILQASALTPLEK